jgi:hypothetical protein
MFADLLFPSWRQQTFRYLDRDQRRQAHLALEGSSRDSQCQWRSFLPVSPPTRLIPNLMSARRSFRFD